MKLSHLSLAMIASVSIATVSHAAGLERSQQPILPLFIEGNYAEVNYAYVNPDLKGTDALGNKVPNMMEDYGMVGAVAKIAPTKNSALALFYNGPWGVDSSYPTGNMFNNQYGATEAHVKTESIGIVAAGKPTDRNFWVYGGVEHQSISGNVKGATPVGLSTVLEKANVSQDAYQQLVKGQKAGVLNAEQAGQLEALQASALAPTLYNLDFDKETTWVPMVGFAFEKPEIAMRTAITYRAPAKYSVHGIETISSPLGTSDETHSLTDVTFPQSVSVDFQTGLSRKHQLLGMVNARWVEWSKFEVSPPLSTQLRNGEPLAEYADDQYSVEVAVAKQFTPRFAAEIRAAYDSGTGQPLSLLGPYNAVTSLAIGAEYDLTDQLTVGGGAQYLHIEGGEIPSDDPKTPALSMEDSDGYALGMKVGYHF